MVKDAPDTARPAGALPPRTRPATVEDIAPLAAIAERSYAHAFAGIMSAEELAARDAASFVPRFTAALERLTVVEADGRPAGFGLVTDGHIDLLFLDPARIGAGLGRALLAHLAAAGARSLECFADNQPARGFYERMGWRLERAYIRPYQGRDRAFVRYVAPPR